jgi:hypothetical protein
MIGVECQGAKGNGRAKGYQLSGRTGGLAVKGHRSKTSLLTCFACRSIPFKPTMRIDEARRKLNPLQAKNNIVKIVVGKTVVAKVTTANRQIFHNHCSAVVTCVSYSIPNVPHVVHTHSRNIRTNVKINCVGSAVTPKDNAALPVERFAFEDEGTVALQGNTLAPLPVAEIKG